MKTWLPQLPFVHVTALKWDRSVRLPLGPLRPFAASQPLFPVRSLVSPAGSRRDAVGGVIALVLGRLWKTRPGNESCDLGRSIR